MSDIEQWQALMAGTTGGGWLDYDTAHAMFNHSRWPDGSYWDLVEGSYYIPV